MASTPSKVVVASSHFDDLIAIGQLWRPGKLPSELLTYYAPDVARRWHITPADWYAFDLAATVRWAELQRERQGRQNERQDAGVSGVSHAPRGSGVPGAAGVVPEQGDRLVIRGAEIPPWDARYRIGSRQRR